MIEEKIFLAFVTVSTFSLFLVDEPDVKIYVKCVNAVGRKIFKTKVARNQKNPIWNETFRFVLPVDAKDGIIEVSDIMTYC